MYGVTALGAAAATAARGAKFCTAVGTPWEKKREFKAPPAWAKTHQFPLSPFCASNTTSRLAAVSQPLLGGTSPTKVHSQAVRALRPYNRPANAHQCWQQRSNWPRPTEEEIPKHVHTTHNTQGHYCYFPESANREDTTSSTSRNRGHDLKKFPRISDRTQEITCLTNFYN